MAQIIKNMDIYIYTHIHFLSIRFMPPAEGGSSSAGSNRARSPTRSPRRVDSRAQEPQEQGRQRTQLPRPKNRTDSNQTDSSNSSSALSLEDLRELRIVSLERRLADLADQLDNVRRVALDLARQLSEVRLVLATTQMHQGQPGTPPFPYP